MNKRNITGAGQQARHVKTDCEVRVSDIGVEPPVTTTSDPAPLNY